MVLGRYSFTVSDEYKFENKFIQNLPDRSEFICRAILRQKLLSMMIMVEEFQLVNFLHGTLNGCLFFICKFIGVLQLCKFIKYC